MAISPWKNSGDLKEAAIVQQQNCGTGSASRNCAQPRMPNKHFIMPHNMNCTMSPDRENGTSPFLYGWFGHLLTHLQTFLRHSIINLLPAKRKLATLLHTHYSCYYSCSRGIKDQKRCAWRHRRTEKVCFRKCQCAVAYYSTSALTNCVRSQIFMEH